jgi:hypothetical protein
MVMESLFRFTLRRPSIVSNDQPPAIILSQNSEFQISIFQALNTENPRESVERVARAFVNDDAFIGHPTDLIFYEELKKLGSKLDVLEKKTHISYNEMVNAITDTFGKSPKILIKEKLLEIPISSLRDSIIAIKLLPEEHSRQLENIIYQLRELELIIRAADAHGFPFSGNFLRRYHRRPLQLPIELKLRSVLSTADLEKEEIRKRKEFEDKRLSEANSKLELYNRIKTAIDEITRIDTKNLQISQQSSDAGFVLPSAFRPIDVFMQEMTRQQQLAQINLTRAHMTVGKIGATEEELQSRTESENSEKPLGTSNSESKMSRRFHSGSTVFNPSLSTETEFKFKESAERLLSPSTAELLKQRGISISQQRVDYIIEVLQNELVNLSKDLDTLFGRPVHYNFKSIGNVLVKIRTPMSTIWNNMVIKNDIEPRSVSFIPNSLIPKTHGNVLPAGIMELLIVKQQLVRYEGADVGHIENVLKGEKKDREYTRFTETQELVFRETEVTTSEERELETTSRFEMTQETNKTIREDSSRRAGLTISGSYGPSVDFSASAEGSTSGTREQSTTTAVTFSKEITERSSQKLIERILEQKSLRVTNQITDKNLHTLDNVKGTGNISGVYQWISKAYQAQMFNYGLRTIYDFMIPEPAAFLIACVQKMHASAVEIEKPTPFTLLPVRGQIEEDKIPFWIHEYGAGDIDPPPEIYKTKSLDFNGGNGDEKTDYLHSAQIVIDDGYKAIFGTVGLLKNIWTPDASCDIILGSVGHRFTNNEPWVWSTELGGERDSIPFALQSWQVSDLAVAVEVKCVRTERAMEKWRLDTHTKLHQAYQVKMSEYEEKLRKLEMESGISISGKHPALNLEIMKDELKKNCIAILTDQHFDMFDSIDSGSNGLPQINIAASTIEGSYVRFFEQAFEWENITWLTYPYFWGRKTKWEERISFEDTDPFFNQFLKAGFCRVSVPARPGFEGAIDHFMTLGKLWNGGPLPTVSSPLYVPIAAEIAERLNRPGDELPEGEPWLVRIPTNLIRLRPDDKLPSWTQDNNGEWIES